MQCTTYSSRDLTIKEERPVKESHSRQTSRHTTSKEETYRQPSKSGKPKNKKAHGRTHTLPARTVVVVSQTKESPAQSSKEQSPAKLSLNSHHLSQIKRLESIIQKQKDLIDSYEQQLTTDRSFRLRSLYPDNIAIGTVKQSSRH